jgi:hypothetical protein
MNSGYWLMYLGMGVLDTHYLVIKDLGNLKCYATKISLSTLAEIGSGL